MPFTQDLYEPLKGVLKLWVLSVPKGYCVKSLVLACGAGGGGGSFRSRV